MPIDIGNLDKPARFYWPDDPEGKEWIELRTLNRKQTVELFKKAGINQTAEFKVNHLTKNLERVSFLDSNLDKDVIFSDLMLDGVIINWNFATPDGQPIPCTKENKLLLANNTKFRTWIDECLEIMRKGEKKKEEEDRKN